MLESSQRNVEMLISDQDFLELFNVYHTIRIPSGTITCDRVPVVRHYFGQVHQTHVDYSNWSVKSLWHHHTNAVAFMQNCNCGFTSARNSSQSQDSMAQTCRWDWQVSHVLVSGKHITGTQVRTHGKNHRGRWRRWTHYWFLPFMRTCPPVMYIPVYILLNVSLQR